MFIGAFLAASVQRAGHPAQSPRSSPGCPLCQQHSRVPHCPTGMGDRVLPHATALPPSHRALRAKGPAAAAAPLQTVTLALCSREWERPQALHCPCRQPCLPGAPGTGSCGDGAVGLAAAVAGVGQNPAGPGDCPGDLSHRCGGPGDPEALLAQP